MNSFRQLKTTAEVDDDTTLRLLKIFLNGKRWVASMTALLGCEYRDLEEVVLGIWEVLQFLIGWIGDDGVRLQDHRPGHSWK